jgi:NAD(P)-dependent dehydrogenase (short-subunit alcohol dehydrogenase family)
MDDSVVWVSGATQGIGAAIARHVPFPARVINISRRQHPDLETLVADISEPPAWARIADHFDHVLTDFRGPRAIFVHNAFDPSAIGPAGNAPVDVSSRQVLANVAAPIVLSDAFVRSCRRGTFEAGLILLSSYAGHQPVEGHASYGAGKASVEHWARAVRRERRRQDGRPWILIVRPGLVDTPSTRAEAAMDDSAVPLASFIRAQFESGLGMSPDDIAPRIWASTPPSDDTWLIDFASTP